MEPRKQFGMDCVPTFDEQDLKLSGRGYMVDVIKLK
jgi:hypothetical protein